MTNVAGKAYGMNVLTPMKPCKTWINTAIFRAGRIYPDTLSGLLGLSLIHFARWVMIRPKQWPDLGQGAQTQMKNDYMLFCSNFNGTWDQYIDAFSDGIPNGLDLFWWASTGYPHSITITPFKDYILHNQYDTNYYYDATPGSAQRDIKGALRVYIALLKLAQDHKTLSAEDFAALYSQQLTVIQNDLGTPGYAPVASNDTREADWNREAAMKAAINERATREPHPGPPSKPAPKRPPRAAKTTSFDGGHYFLTCLIPVQNQSLVTHYGVECSAVQRLREVLATLPTALQSQATEGIGLNSPFARSRRTHLARFVVINDVQYQGRDGEDAIFGAVRMAAGGAPMTEPQHQDRLSCPFLLFSADIDAPDGSVESLRSYFQELWRTMEPELRGVLENCYGYERIRDVESFCDYLLACEVETTMPFNDYWAEPPPLKNRVLETLLPPALLLAAGNALALGLGPTPLAVLASAGSTALAGWWAVHSVLSIGGEPFPAAPHSDLPSVLKALYMQQHFVRFAIDAQGLDATTLHAGFGEFLHRHRPGDLNGPTQPPGVIRSPATAGDQP